MPCQIYSDGETHEEALKASRGSYIPSPKEIQAACLQIQKGWSEYERKRRCGWKSIPWTVPRARTDAHFPQQ
ncbi:MAG: hypothetical protein HYR90_02200 [Candidatus Andersenbacteria bacterium]|nr:hypothetical protein [Candidatus Andersenbacteria bacterium]